MTRQVETRSVSVDSVVRDPAFRKGVADYDKGRAPDWDQYGSNTNKAWAYERGRAAAAWAKGAGRRTPLQWFQDRRLTWDAKAFGRDALRAGAVR